MHQSAKCRRCRRASLLQVQLQQTPRSPPGRSNTPCLQKTRTMHPTRSRCCTSELWLSRVCLESVRLWQRRAVVLRAEKPSQAPSKPPTAPPHPRNTQTPPQRRQGPRHRRPGHRQLAAALLPRHVWDKAGGPCALPLVGRGGNVLRAGVCERRAVHHYAR